jgi:hypothetical protein
MHKGEAASSGTTFMPILILNPAVQKLSGTKDDRHTEVLMLCLFPCKIHEAGYNSA